MNTTAIAQHLNVTENLITEVQEWARVLWVRVKGLGCRFVSKKVVEMKYPEKLEKTMYCNPESLRGVRIGDTFRKDNKAVYRVVKILKEGFVWEQDGVEYTEHPGGYCDEKYRVEVIGQFWKMVK